VSPGRRLQIGLLGLACLVGVAPAAGQAQAQAAARTEAGHIASPAAGYDISYPQCNTPFPTNPVFAIVGVNGGLPYAANPCLGSGNGPSELAWAGTGAALYANTANPGAALSSHWPNGQSSPKQCNTATNPGADTAECAYDYGWNTAADSYQDAVNAFISLGWAPAGATRTPRANQWWLDVETANSWTPVVTLNIAALQGEVDYLPEVAESGVVDETLVTIHTTCLMAIRRPRVCSPDGDSRELRLLNAPSMLCRTRCARGSRSVDPEQAPQRLRPRLGVAAQSRARGQRCRT
jgi:hypothetical protein